MLPTLTENRDANSCPFIIEPAAIGYGASTISFAIHNGFLTGRVGDVGERIVTVSTTTIANLLVKHDFDVINLVCDCEGSEIDIVNNELEVLKRHVRCLILETHEWIRGGDKIAGMLSD
jgi:FkbM family methyltransferase